MAYHTPEEEDYVIQCDGFRYTARGVNGYLGTFTDRDDAEGAIREDQRDSPFYPDVWFVNDHGNAEIIDITWFV